MVISVVSGYHFFLKIVIFFWQNIYYLIDALLFKSLGSVRWYNKKKRNQSLVLTKDAFN